MKQNYIRMFAIFASILMLTIVAVPMVAAEDEYCDEAQSPTPDITLYDFCGAEIEIINGLPFIIIESENECIHIPLPLSDTKNMMVDGVPITVEVNENYLLLPTEYGIEKTCISEFDVKVINGNLMIMHEVNPLWLLPIKMACAFIISTIFINVLESRGSNICCRCEFWIKAGGMGFTLVSGIALGKFTSHTAANMVWGIPPDLIGILTGLIATAITCNNKNCMFYRL